MKTGKTYTKDKCSILVVYADDKSALVETLPRPAEYHKGNPTHDGGFRFNVPKDSWDTWTFSPPIMEQVVYINIYKLPSNLFSLGDTFDSAEKASKAAGGQAIARKKVVIEYREGEFDE